MSMDRAFRSRNGLNWFRAIPKCGWTGLQKQPLAADKS